MSTSAGFLLTFVGGILGECTSTAKESPNGPAVLAAWDIGDDFLLLIEGTLEEPSVWIPGDNDPARLYPIIGYCQYHGIPISSHI